MATGEKSLEVLLIEDNPEDILLIMDGLRNSKVVSHVSVVSHGEEAIDFLYKRGRHTGAPCPDIILINFSLPGKNGWEVLAEIESDESLRLIPVIVLTSSKADRDLFTKYQLHVNSFLTKPLNVPEFTTLIQLFEQYWLLRSGVPPQFHDT